MKHEYSIKYANEGYAVIKNYLDNQTKNLLFNHTLLKRQVSRYMWKEKQKLFSPYMYGYPFGDVQVKGSYCHYSDPIFESLLYSSTKDMSNYTNKKLHPTYTYYRVYEPGAVMKKHVDRDSCKHSMTLCLGYTDKVWPIYLEGTPINLEPGDLLVYRGDKLKHWRDPLPSGYQSQVFLHYIEEGAENWERDKFDTRPLLMLDGRFKTWSDKGLPTDKNIMEYLKQSEYDYNKIHNNR